VQRRTNGGYAGWWWEARNIPDDDISRGRGGFMRDDARLRQFGGRKNGTGTQLVYTN